ncbi:MAG: hypothetical protein NT103_05375 [Campylobacterales bacterium]|nr:hypothetical protein [Campylobacterales bacterium]
MKIVLVIVCFTFITNAYAEKKWIPIESIGLNEKLKPDSNKSSLPVNKWIENAQVIKHLLDHTSKDDENSENKKNWYDFDKLQND